MKIKSKSATIVEEEAPGVLRHVPLDHLVDHDEITNRKLNKKHVEELSESIERNGLDVPVIAWDGGDPENKMQIGGKKSEPVPATFLVAGAHRRAALEAYRKRNASGFAKHFPEGIPTKVMTGELQDALLAQLRENVARENPDAETLLPFIKRLSEDFGLKNKVIARRIGKSDAYVSMVLDIERELGEEGTEDVKSGKVSLSKAMNIAAKSKKAKKKGETFDTKAALEKAKSKRKAGSKQDERRISVKTLYARYKALPNMKIGAAKELLEALLDYVVGDSDDVPEDLENDEEEEEAPNKKVLKKKSK